MGIFTDYFVAPSDEVAAAVLASGPADVPGLPVLQMKGMEPIVIMGSLEAILTGRDFDEVCDNPRQGLMLVYEADGGTSVTALTDELRDALASSDENRLRAAGAELAATEEVAAADGEDVEAVVDGVLELAALARTARERGEGMYCWLCL